MTGNPSFFNALAPGLVANILTVVFVYSFVKISQKERSGEEEGGRTYPLCNEGQAGIYLYTLNGERHDCRQN